MRRRAVAFGFSLIELMIVVSIISILAVIAIPSYRIYTERARFAEVISTAQIYKIAVSLALAEGAALTELSNGQHGIPDSPKGTANLATLTVTNGIITAIGTDRVNQATYVLKPLHDGEEWQVTGTCIKQNLCNV